MTTTITQGTRVEVTDERHVHAGRQGTATTVRTTDGTEYANGTDVWVTFDDDTYGFFAAEQLEPVVPPTTKRRDLTAIAYSPLSSPYRAGKALADRARLDERMRGAGRYYSETLDAYVSIPED